MGPVNGPPSLSRLRRCWLTHRKPESRSSLGGEEWREATHIPAQHQMYLDLLFLEGIDMARSEEPGAPLFRRLRLSFDSDPFVTGRALLLGLSLLLSKSIGQVHHTSMHSPLGDDACSPHIQPTSSQILLILARLLCFPASTNCIRFPPKADYELLLS